jgi:hypothetical protein
MEYQLKYKCLRTKQADEKDLEMNRVYKKKRLQEVRLQELIEETEKLGSYSIADKDEEVQD